MGYANSLALLAALAFVLALGLDGAAAIAARPARSGRRAAAEHGHGRGARARARCVSSLTPARPVRALALLVLPLAGALAVRGAGSVVNPPPTDLLSAAHTGHRLLLLLVLLMLAQGVLALASRVLPLGEPAVVRAGRALLALAAGARRARRRAVRVRRPRARALLARCLARARGQSVLGSGAGTFADWWLRLRTVPQSTHEAHSLYLETLAELGPLGLALLLLALGAGLAGAWRLRRERLGPALLAALVTYCRRGRGRLPLGARGCHGAGDRARRGGHRARRRAAARACASRMSFRRSPRSPSPACWRSPDRPRFSAGDPQRALRFAPYSSAAWQALAEQRRARGDIAGRDRVRTATRSSSIRTTGARGASSRPSRKERRAASRLAEAARLESARWYDSLGALAADRDLHEPAGRAAGEERLALDACADEHDERVARQRHVDRRVDRSAFAQPFWSVRTSAPPFAQAYGSGVTLTSASRTT